MGLSIQENQKNDQFFVFFRAFLPAVFYAGKSPFYPRNIRKNGRKSFNFLWIFGIIKNDIYNISR